MKYSEKDLSKIAEALNLLVKATKDEILSKINVSSYAAYFSKKKYIDYNGRLKKFKVYIKFTGWLPPNKYGD